MTNSTKSEPYLVGVDGGGSGTRLVLARADGVVIARSQAGPSGLGLGIERAWQAIGDALAVAFEQIGMPLDWTRCVLGCGLAGANQADWSAAFRRVAPPVRALALESDAYTTLLGAHGGAPGVIVALGTGSIAAVLAADGHWRIAGGYGFPSGDEASGAWLGLRAIAHAQRVLDGRTPPDDFATALIAVTGARDRDELVVWCTQATQTRYAALAPIVLAHAGHSFAARLLEQAGQDIDAMVAALDPDGALPVALCGGLAAPLAGYAGSDVRQRLVAAQGDSAGGALQLARRVTIDRSRR
jgi:glucosamine kinase